MLKHPIREDAPPGKRLKPINAPTTEADSSALSAEGSTYITSSSAGGLCTTTATTSSSTTTTNSSAGAAALVRSADDAASSPSSPSYRHSPKSATDNQLDKENEKMMAFLCGRTPHRSSSAPTTTTTSPTTNKKTRTKAFKFPMKLFYILECGDFNDSVSWTEDGKAFQVLSEALFIRDVLPSVFKEAKFASFHRKLNRWHFQKLNKKENTYMHPRFLRGRIDFCQTISVGNNGHPLLYDNFVEANQQLYDSASGNNTTNAGSRDMFAPNGGANYMLSNKKLTSYGMECGMILPRPGMTGMNSSSTAMLRSRDASLLMSAQHQMAQRRALLGAGMGGNHSEMNYDAGANAARSSTGMAPQGMQSSFMRNQGSMNMRTMQDPSLEMNYIDMMYMGGMTTTGQQQRMQEMNSSMNANFGGMQFGNAMDSGLTNQGFGLSQQFHGRPNMPQISQRQLLNQSLDPKIGQHQFLNQNLDHESGHRQFLNQNLDPNIGQRQFLNQNLDSRSNQFSNQQSRRLEDFNPPSDSHHRRLADFNRDSHDGKNSAGI